MVDRSPLRRVEESEAHEAHRHEQDGYEAPAIVVIGPLEEITFGTNGMGTDSTLKMGL